MAKKQDCRDFFSLVSDDILILILCLTESYKTAVVCSVVSKRWLNLYKMLPCLYLEEREFSYKGTTVDMHRKKQKILVSNNLAISISRHQKNSIQSLFLVGTHKRYHIWEWCLEYILARNALHHLTMSLSERNYDAIEHFPVAAFSCSSLVSLTLHGFFIDHIPHTLPALLNLQKCALSLYVSYDSDVQGFTSWLPKFPALQNLQVMLHFVSGECMMPIVISSPCLLNLHIDCKEPFPSRESPLTIRILTPELLVMKLQSFNCFGEPMEVRLEAPKLLEMSLLSDYFEVHTGEIPEGIRGVCNAKWSQKDHHLISLSFDNDSFSEAVPILNIISSFSALKFLQLSDIYSNPKNFWRMLTSLPMLEKLILMDCDFVIEDDQQYLDEEKYSLTRLAEISLTLDFRSFLAGARELLGNLLPITPNLKMLTLALKSKKSRSRNAYAALFGEILSHADYLSLKNSSVQLEFNILDKSCPH